MTARRLMAVALLAALPFGASATTMIAPEGQTSVEVTADVGALGLGAAPTGTATVSTTGTNPVFFFPITGGIIRDDGTASIEHDGSGVELFALAMPSTSAEVGNFEVDTGARTVFGNVNGGVPPALLFDLGMPTAEGIPLLISSDLAGALSAVFDAPDLTGAQFGLANTAPSPVPLPAALPVLAAGIAGLYLVGRRRRH